MIPTLLCSSSRREFDVVVLGPNGYQGRRVLAELDELAHSGIRLAAAGRAAMRIETTLRSLRKPGKFRVFGGIDARSLPQMEELAASSLVLLSCCGDCLNCAPVVVAACAAQGTHYLDASLGCHLEQLEEMWPQLFKKYGKEAEQNGALILNSLGFDTVTADFGVLLMSRLFMPPSAPHAIASFLTLRAPRGFVLRKATFLQHAQRAQPTQRRPSPPCLRIRISGLAAAVGAEKGSPAEESDTSAPPPSPADPPLGANGPQAPAGFPAVLMYCKELASWAVRGASCEAPLVYRTQELQRLGCTDRATPVEQPAVQAHVPAVHYSTHLTVSTLLFATLYVLERLVVWLAGRTERALAWAGVPSWGRGSLMASRPIAALLTWGGLVTDDDGRFEESELAKSFRKTFLGRGASVLPGAQPGGDCTQERHTVTMSGPSPGYAVTPASLALAALTLAQQSRVRRLPGGFSTPVVALEGTDFWEKLVDRCGIQIREE